MPPLPLYGHLQEGDRCPRRGRQPPPARLETLTYQPEEQEELQEALALQIYHHWMAKTRLHLQYPQYLLAHSSILEPPAMAPKDIHGPNRIKTALQAKSHQYLHSNPSDLCHHLRVEVGLDIPTILCNHKTPNQRQDLIHP